MLAAYLITINLLTVVFFASDKISARANAWRTPERTLLLLALLGGSPAALFAMRLFRHKTRKATFQALFTIILLVQLGLGLTYYQYIYAPKQARLENFLSNDSI